VQKITLSDEKKNDLRRQHFNLGFDDETPMSTYADNYYKKNVEPLNTNDKQ
jgi:hypothetical protein